MDDNREAELSEGCGCLVMLAALAVLVVSWAVVSRAAAVVGR